MRKTLKLILIFTLLLSFVPLGLFTDVKETKAETTDLSKEITKENSLDHFKLDETSTPETITIFGNVGWKDNNNQDGIRPEKTTVHLMNNDKEVAIKEVSEKDGWQYSFTGLPKYADGKEIKYTVKEDGIDNYATNYDGNNIINTQVDSWLGDIIWEDNNNQDGKRPDKVIIWFMANGKRVIKKEITAKDNWKYDFIDVPVYVDGGKIDSGTEDDNIPGYKLYLEKNENSERIQHIHKRIVSYSGEINWEDNNNQDDKRPEKTTVHLLADGKEVDKKEITAKDNWKYNFTDMPKYADGKEIKYTVKEDEASDYETSYEGNNIKNKYVPEITRITGDINWEDNNNQDDKRPEKTTVHLLADGKEIDKKEITAKDNWKYSFENVPKYVNGKEIKYTVKEDNIRIEDGIDGESYATSYDGNNIINTRVHLLCGNIYWNDNNNKDRLRPDKVSIDLRIKYKGFGKKDFGTIEVTAKDNWKYVFKDVPVYDTDGTKLTKFNYDYLFPDTFPADKNGIMEYDLQY